MFIWGSRTQAKEIGGHQTMHCPVCEKERPFTVVLTYHHSHIYYIFGAVSKKSYHRICTICNRGEVLDAKKVEAEFTKSPIPFMHRYGALVFLGIVAAIITSAAMSSP